MLSRPLAACGVRTIPLCQPSALVGAQGKSRPKNAPLSQFVRAADALQTSLRSAMFAEEPLLGRTAWEIKFDPAKLDADLLANALRAGEQLTAWDATSEQRPFVDQLAAIVQTLGAQLLIAATSREHAPVGTGLCFDPSTGEIEFVSDSFYSVQSSLWVFFGASGLSDCFTPFLKERSELPQDRPDCETLSPEVVEKNNLLRLRSCGAGVVLGGKIALGLYTNPQTIAGAVAPFFEASQVTVQLPAPNGKDVYSATAVYLGKHLLPLPRTLIAVEEVLASNLH